MKRLTVLAEWGYYLPTYLIDDKGQDATGECSLFVRHFTLTQAPSGKRKLRILSEVESYPNADAMVDAIEERGLRELPAEADGDLLYVPEELRQEDVAVERSFQRRRPKTPPVPVLRRGLTRFERARKPAPASQPVHEEVTQ